MAERVKVQVLIPKSLLRLADLVCQRQLGVGRNSLVAFSLALTLGRLAKGSDAIAFEPNFLNALQAEWDSLMAAARKAP